MLYANSLAANATIPDKDAMLCMTEVDSAYSGLGSESMVRTCSPEQPLPACA